MKPWQKLAAAFAVAAVIIGVGVAFRIHQTGTEQSKPATSASRTTNHDKSSTTSKAKPQRKALTDTQTAAYTKTAIAFEHATREWGTDPALADTPSPTTPDLAARLRTPDALDPTPLNTVSTITVDKTVGPYAASVECAQYGADSGQCKAYPNGLEHQRRTHWAMGARLVGEPQVTVAEDGTVTVKGQVKVILWSGVQNTYAETMPDGTVLWALRPLTGVTDFEDKLVLSNDGMKVTRRQTVVQPATWLADPWYSDWTDDALNGNGSLDQRVVHDIAVIGAEPDMDANGVNPDMGAQILDNQTTQPWDGWDTLKSQHGWATSPGDDNPDDYWDPSQPVA